MLQGASEIGDVAVDLQNCQGLVARLLQGDPAAVDDERTAIAPRMFQFSLPGLSLVKRAIEFLWRDGATGFQKFMDILSQYLLLTPPVEPACSLIPEQHAPVLVMHDKSIMSSLQELCLPAILLLAPPAFPVFKYHRWLLALSTRQRGDTASSPLQ